VKTGIWVGVVRHDFQIPTCVGMTKRLRNSTYDTKPLLGKGEVIIKKGAMPPSFFIYLPPLQMERGKI